MCEMDLAGKEQFAAKGGGGYPHPSKILATPLPSVFHFHEQTPTPPVPHKTGDHPSPFPVPKPVLRVERPARRGGDPTPPVTIRGGGVSHEWGGGTLPAKKFQEAPHPPARIFLCRPPPPGSVQKGGGGGLRKRGDYPPLVSGFCESGRHLLSVPVPGCPIYFHRYLTVY